MKASITQWRTVLTRWRGMPESPEVNLITDVLAHALAHCEDVDADQFFADGFRLYCAAIWLDPDFVLESARAPDAKPRKPRKAA